MKKKSTPILNSEAIYEYESKHMLCENMSFAAAEAYKLMRTNILFSFADENDSRVIGVSSALSGEGKSLTSINTAYTLAQLGKKVLLVEADLRIPLISKRLHMKKSPGLSNLLVGLNKFSETVQKYTSKKGDVTFDVMVAGDVPPNPSELLGSDRMNTLIPYLTQQYNFIIMDIPPIVSVTDTLVVSKLTNGIVIVVRQDYCNRVQLAETVKQLEFVNARVLGFVFNGATDTQTGYRKGYSKSYYRRYYSEPYLLAAKGDKKQ